jgi:hypothetical protein
MTILALLEWFALSLQCWLTVNLSISNGKTLLGGVLTFFSYFTILSNLLVALALSFILWNPGSRLGGFFARATTQSGVAVYIAIVGIVYSLVLRQIWNPQGLQKLADVLLHDLLPLLYVVFWFLFVSRKCLRWMDAVKWLVFPGIYCGYVLIRGALTGWYPYPFLDAGQSGYARVSVNALVLLSAFLVVGWSLIAIGRRRGQSAPAE